MPSSPAPSPAMPTGPSLAQQRAERAASPRCAPTACSSRSTAAPGTAASSSSMRRSSARNSKRRKSSPIVARSGGSASAWPRSTSSGRSRSIVARSFERSASSRCSISVCRRFSPGTAVDVRVDALERAEAHEQVGGGLVADAGHARDVVGRVALEPDEVGHEPRRDAVAGLDALGRVDVHVGHAARREQHADVLGDELERVAIVRDHARRDPLLVRAQAERADHVVGLVALELDVAVPEGLDERAQVRLLLLEQRRRRLARRLVAREALEAVHGPRVPGHDHALGVVVGEQPHEHVREAEQRVRREAVGRRELLGQRVVGPVGERVAVDQEQARGARGTVAEVELGGLGGHPSIVSELVWPAGPGASPWRNGGAARYCGMSARPARRRARPRARSRRAGRGDPRERDAGAARSGRSISCASSRRPRRRSSSRPRASRRERTARSRCRAGRHARRASRAAPAR